MQGSHRAPHLVIQAITSEGLAQGPYVATRGGVEPATFRTEGTEHNNSASPLSYAGGLVSRPRRFIVLELIIV